MTRDEVMLQQYAADRSEAAFAALVCRYMDFVFSVCRRQLGDDTLAADVAQTVFLLLAAKAGALPSGVPLSGWLFRTAHHACRNARRVEARRRHYEGKAAAEMQREADRTQGQMWAQAGPDLDDVMAALRAGDRDALLLRYVEGLSLEELAVALSLSPAAAHKRVSRALERMRRSLAGAGAGAALPVATLAALLADQLVQATPPAQAATLTAALSGTPLRIPAPPLPPGGWGRPGLPWRALGGVLLAAAAGVALGGGFARIHPSVRGGSGATMAGPTVTLHGRVKEASGQPAPGVAVTLVRYDGLAGTAAVFARTRTDAAGRYTVANAPAGPGAWSVVADSGAALGFGAPGTDCLLRPSTRIRLRLTDATGRALAGIRARSLTLADITNTDGPVVSLPLGGPDRLTAVSDSAGVATFAGLPQGFAGSFEVRDSRWVRRPPDAEGLPLASSPDSGIWGVRLTPGASITGRVVLPDGRPAADVRVGAQELATAAWGEAQTDATGRYRITGLPQGRFNVAVDENSPVLNGQWTAAALAALPLNAGRTEGGADLSLTHGAWVTGRITRRATGLPLANEEVGAYGPAHPAPGAWVGAARSGPDGAYRIRVPAGRQHIYPMSAAGSGLSADVTVPPKGLDAVDFAVQ